MKTKKFYQMFPAVRRLQGTSFSMEEVNHEASIIFREMALLASYFEESFKMSTTMKTSIFLHQSGLNNWETKKLGKMIPIITVYNRQIGTPIECLITDISNAVRNCNTC